MGIGVGGSYDMSPSPSIEINASEHVCPVGVVSGGDENLMGK
jgi:hypothetical protein